MVSVAAASESAGDGKCHSVPSFKKKTFDPILMYRRVSFFCLCFRAAELLQGKGGHTPPTLYTRTIFLADFLHTNEESADDDAADAERKKRRMWRGRDETFPKAATASSCVCLCVPPSV